MRVRSGFGRLGLEDEKLSSSFDFRIVLRLLEYVRPHKFLAIVSLLAMLVYAATEVAGPWLIKMAIDGVISSDKSRLTLVALLLVSNALLGYVTNYLHLIALSRIGQNLLFGLRTATFDHLQRLSMSYFDRTEAGKNMSRVQNDVQQLQEFLSIFTLAVGDILRLAGFIVAMLLMNWELALITLSVIPLLFIIVIVWQTYAWPSFMRVQKKSRGG